MTTKPHSGLAASGPADDPESDQITKEHNEDDPSQDISIDPSEDVTVEAAEDVTTEAAGETPPPSFRDSGGASPGQRAPTLMGVPIQSLPLPGVTATSNGESTRTIDYDEEVTVLAEPKAPITDPLAILDQFDRPSITDDDEEETKVEPAEAAMKAAASIDDVSTALSTQASLEREKALRRSVPAASPSDDLEFADPEADDERDAEPQEEESLDDELSDEDEVISAGGAIEEEEDLDENDGVGDGVATATFMKPIDSTGLSGLLNPRRPPTGGRDGFGSRLPTPYPPPQMAVPAPSTSPFASRLGPAPIGSPYGARATGTAIPALQVPPPSGAAATTASEPGFFTKQLPVPAYALIALVAGSMLAGFGFRGLFLGKSAPVATNVTVAKPAVAPTAPAAPVVEPVAGSAVGTTTETKPAAPVEAAKAVVPAGEPPGAMQAQAGTGPTEKPAAEAADQGLPKPAKKAVAKPHKPAVDPMDDEGAAKAAVASSPKPVTPKPALEKAPKLASAPAAPKPAAGKPAKKPAKVWVDPFAQ